MYEQFSTTKPNVSDVSNMKTRPENGLLAERKQGTDSDLVIRSSGWCVPPNIKDTTILHNLIFC